MSYTGRFGQADGFRREELIRVIEHSVENLTLQELEALYYDMSTKNYINTILEWNPGNHFVDSEKRTAKGFAWVLNNR